MIAIDYFQIFSNAKIWTKKLRKPRLEDFPSYYLMRVRDVTINLIANYYQLLILSTGRRRHEDDVVSDELSELHVEMVGVSVEHFGSSLVD